MLTKSLIQKTFTSATMERGEALYRAKRVVTVAEDGQFIRGSVRSASDWDITYLATLEVTEDKLFTRCTCPVKTQCKHAAALCHHILATKQHWADEDKDIENWLSAITPVTKTTSLSTRKLLYFLNPDDYSGQQRIDITLRTSTEKKTGGWSRSMTNEYVTADLMKKALPGRQ